jgi:NAD(P)H-dependent FMN reductase
MNQKKKKKVLAISGSTRKFSVNASLIKAIAMLAGADIDMELFNGLSELPHFNPDLDTDEPPNEVTTFRRLLREADGVLICTPEYAMGVVGSLKNALDWTVSSCEFSKKPVALITASTSGEKAHAALMETLKVIEANVENTQLLISFAKTKINAENTITDAKTLNAVHQLIEAFVKEMDHLEQ